MDKQIEQNGIVYCLVGNYYLPDLKLPQQSESPDFGRYGRMHLKFLKDNKRFVYSDLIMSDKLNEMLSQIDREANELFIQSVKDLSENQGVTEQLKAENQLKWVGMMNNIRHAADEIVLNELIYRKKNTDSRSCPYCHLILFPVQVS